MTQYIVLMGQVICSDGKIDVVYGFDGERFKDRNAAIRHGLQERGSDDFNIGVLERGRLVSLDWMHDSIEALPDRLATIADQIGVRA